ncbi:hypothetical protein BDAP_002055 [Binucleata daphniae]
MKKYMKKVFDEAVKIYNNFNNEKPAENDDTPLVVDFMDILVQSLQLKSIGLQNLSYLDIFCYYIVVSLICAIIIVLFSSSKYESKVTIFGAFKNIFMTAIAVNIIQIVLLRMFFKDNKMSYIASIYIVALSFVYKPLLVLLARILYAFRLVLVFAYSTAGGYFIYNCLGLNECNNEQQNLYVVCIAFCSFLNGLIDTKR